MNGGGEGEVCVCGGGDLCVCVGCVCVCVGRGGHEVYAWCAVGQVCVFYIYSKLVSEEIIPSQCGNFLYIYFMKVKLANIISL